MVICRPYDPGYTPLFLSREVQTMIAPPAKHVKQPGSPASLSMAPLASRLGPAGGSSRGQPLLLSSYSRKGNSCGGCIYNSSIKGGRGALPWAGEAGRRSSQVIGLFSLLACESCPVDGGRPVRTNRHGVGGLARSSVPIVQMVLPTGPGTE